MILCSVSVVSSLPLPLFWLSSKITLPRSLLGSICHAKNFASFLGAMALRDAEKAKKIIQAASAPTTILYISPVFLILYSISLLYKLFSLMAVASFALVCGIGCFSV